MATLGAFDRTPSEFSEKKLCPEKNDPKKKTKIVCLTAYSKNIAKILGVKNLFAAKVMSTDIRASASLIIAALCSEGETHLSRIYHIDRGYENIDDRLRALGASIERI